MRDVHPHWHTTQDDAHPVSPTADAAPQQPMIVDTVMPQGAVTVSRRPAAIVGILIVIGIGYSLFQGIGGLLGQLSRDDKVLILITAEGFSPKKISAQPGQTIVWKNQDSIPHILFSDTLKMEGDMPLQTSPIFKDGEATLTIPVTHPLGEFPYGSRTKVNFTGSIVIEQPVPAAAASSSSAETQSSLPMMPPFAPPVAVSSQSLSSSEAFAFPPPSFLGELAPFEEQPAGGVPENPYTVDSNVIPNPSMSGQVTSRAPLFNKVKNKPVTQPESGPGAVWAIGIFSAALLLVCTRKAFTV